MPSELLHIPYNPSPLSKHGKILTALKTRFKLSRDGMSKRYSAMRLIDDAVLAYVPLSDVDKRRKAALKTKGQPEYYTIEIPYSYAELLTGHTYLATVWLGRYPIFQYAGRHTETQQQVQGLESLIDYQVQTGGAVPALYIWLYDTYKYGLGVVGHYWDEDYRNFTQRVKQDRFVGGEFVGSFTEETTESVLTFMGNRVFNIRPMDWFPDTRKPVGRFYDGEFVGWHTEVGWHELLADTEGYFYDKENIKVLKAKRFAAIKREEGTGRIELPSSSGGADAFITHDLDNISIQEMHVKLIPEQWGLGSSSRQAMWFFRIANGEVLITASPSGTYSGEFPFAVLEPDFEAYGLHKRSPLEINQPMQDVLTWLFNSHFYNVRKTLNNQFILDPSMVEIADAQSPLAGGIIRAKPSTYGNMKVSDLVAQLPVTDVTRGHITDAKVVIDMAQRMSGISDSLMGLMAQGGRKTATEVRQTTGFGVSRLKTLAEFLSATGFSRLAKLLVQSTQQYYDEEMTFRITGDQSAANTVLVTPDSIAGFFDFIPVEGSIPLDKFSLLNLWKELFLQGSRSPEVMQQFDIAGVFSHIARLSGIRDMDRFRINVVPDDQLQNAATAGNVLPIGGGGGPTRGAQAAPTQSPAVGRAPAVAGVGRLA